MSGLKRTLKLLLEKGCEVGVELEEILVEDLPEEVDWDLRAEVLHERVPEALKELLREASVRNALIRHLKDDIQAPERARFYCLPLRRAKRRSWRARRWRGRGG